MTGDAAKDISYVYWCDGCRDVLPVLYGANGKPRPVTSGCVEKHPSLIPPWFPVRILAGMPAIGGRGLDVRALTVKEYRDPAELGFLPARKRGRQEFGSKGYFDPIVENGEGIQHGETGPGDAAGGSGDGGAGPDGGAPAA